MAGRSSAKAALSHRIMIAGLELFVEQGFDDVTVEQIAARAQVSPITVYRHFGTKADLVFSSREEAAQVLREAAAAVPGDADARRCVVPTLMVLARHPSQDDDVWKLRSQIIARSGHLQRISLGTRVDFETAVAEVLAARPEPGPGLATQVATAAGLSAFHLAVRHWRDAAPGQPLEDVVAQALAMLWPDLVQETSPAAPR